jgi:hypothetical protein
MLIRSEVKYQFRCYRKLPGVEVGDAKHNSRRAINKGLSQNHHYLILLLLSMPDGFHSVRLTLLFGPATVSRIPDTGERDPDTNAGNYRQLSRTFGVSRTTLWLLRSKINCVWRGQPRAALQL